MTIIHFYLLGSFEAQVGTAAGRKPLGNALAAQILAFLAYQNRFCSRNEIVKACWGAAEAAGVNDEAYKRQIYKARDIFPEVLGVPSQDYFHFQSGGAELKDGTFITDLMQFNRLLKTAADQSQSDVIRLNAYRQADKLRRGYLLDGMGCEWIVSQSGGARKTLTERVKAMQVDFESLQASNDAGGPNRVQYCNGFYDAIPALRKAVGSASREIVLYGINFHVTIPMINDLLFDRLHNGVKVKFLLVDPESERIKELAAIVNEDEQVLRDECALSLRKIDTLSKLLNKAGQSSQIEVSTFDGMAPSCMYAIDHDTAAGQLFYFPYMNGVTPTRLPGYLWSRRPDTPYNFYTSELKRMWNAETNKQVCI